MPDPWFTKCSLRAFKQGLSGGIRKRKHYTKRLPRTWRRKDGQLKICWRWATLV